LLTNSNQVPKGRVRRCSYAACSSLLRGGSLGFGGSLVLDFCHAFFDTPSRPLRF